MSDIPHDPRAVEVWKQWNRSRQVERVSEVVLLLERLNTRIADLERENAALRQSPGHKDVITYQKFLETRIAELEAENAKLKQQLQEWVDHE